MMVYTTLLGNTTAQEVGGIICFNSEAPTLIPKNEFNIFTNNNLIKSDVTFPVGQGQESGDTREYLSIQAILILTSIIREEKSIIERTIQYHG